MWESLCQTAFEWMIFYKRGILSMWGGLNPRSYGIMLGTVVITGWLMMRFKINRA